MAFEFSTYAQHYPMAPLGGVFVVVVGLALLCGAVFPHRRLQLLWAGLPIAASALFLSRHLAAGLPAPSALQIASLAVAVLVEVAGFIIVLPRVRRGGERAVILATLGIVGVHFVIMAPAFGSLIVVLGALCVANAAMANVVRTYPLGVVWSVDGTLKLILGAILVCASPVIGGRFT